MEATASTEKLRNLDGRELTHEVIGFGTVLAAILAVILLNRSDVKELRGEIKDLNGKLDAIRTGMHGEFERFYMTLGQHVA